MVLESCASAIDTGMNFREWLTISEMAARRSLARTMGKFQGKLKGVDHEPALNRPVAILTAFRADFDIDKNRAANKKLEQRLKDHGLSFYPVVGSGQEPDTGVPYADEESYVVQPINKEMPEEEFVEIIRKLLLSPTGGGDRSHAQWGAVVKLPSRPKAFLLHHDGEATSTSDYDQEDKLGKFARPARGKPGTVIDKGKEYPAKRDQFYTQMTKGPKAQPSMMRPEEELDRDKQPRRRFTVSTGRKF